MGPHLRVLGMALGLLGLLVYLSVRAFPEYALITALVALVLGGAWFAYSLHERRSIERLGRLSPRDEP
jgi:hypothetical protein